MQNKNVCREFSSTLSDLAANILFNKVVLVGNKKRGAL